jgi:hypothetical protein
MVASLANVEPGEAWRRGGALVEDAAESGAYTGETCQKRKDSATRPAISPAK